MTIVVIGPVCRDLIITGGREKLKTGGPCYFQSFVFEKFYPDYVAVVNCENAELVSDFPDSNKVKVLTKNNTHFFINMYPDSNNPDIRIQSSNFANIPITVNDLDCILSGITQIDAFIVNPLNTFDFPSETIDYLKSYNIPIYISLQGFLRYPLKEIDGNYSIELKSNSKLKDIVCDVEGLFLDEREALFFENDDFNICEIVVTNGSEGSRIIADKEYDICAVDCEEVVDATGCGDTFMAAYISKRLNGESIVDSANFASKIASEKLGLFGPLR